MLMKFLGGIKVYLIVAALATSAGFFGGVRWEKGANLADAEKALEELSVKAQEALVTLGGAWEAEASKAKLAVEEWSLQNERDQELLLRLLAGQTDIRNRFDELDSEITLVTDFGTCQFSDDAVRLLREASERTRTPELPVD